MNWYKNLDKNLIKVGVVGYSAKKFDVEKAKSLISEAFNEIEKNISNVKNFDCVSGLTNVGIPALAYKEAKDRGWKTTGIACKKAIEYEQFDVDNKIIVGENWGDESETFLSNIDVLVKVGGGEQSKNEFKIAKEKGIPCLEYDLELIKE